MKSYIVGGAVRDELLGLPIKDYDYVVVGETPYSMLAKGYSPIGKDFPVFLHPYSKEEYALARTEKKITTGYKGFIFNTASNITLEEDLARRDLTINAIAKDKNGTLIDPFNGIKDIKKRILRHVSNAFTEDPVRILRIARFTARFPNFRIAPETLSLMKNMVNLGELDTLVPERIWREISRGLMEQRPTRMFLTLKKCNAIHHIFPELKVLICKFQCTKHYLKFNRYSNIQALDYTSYKSYTLEVRFAVFTYCCIQVTIQPKKYVNTYTYEELNNTFIQMVCKRLKIPSKCRDLALLSNREYINFNYAYHLNALTTLKLFLRCDAFRRPDRFFKILQSIESHLIKIIPNNIIYFLLQYLTYALKAVLKINAYQISQQSHIKKYNTNLHHFKKAFMLARIKAVKHAQQDMQTRSQ